MSNQRPGLPRTFTKREFIQAAAAVGGTAAALTSLDGWGMGFASSMQAPPELTGNANGTSVVILGGGLAGMAAAYELTMRGYNCRILEARSFAGGRCQSARNGVQIEEVDGTKRTCEFDEGHYFNHGAWRLPSYHHAVFHYVRKFGIPMEIMIQECEQGYIQNDNAEGPLAGRRFRPRELKADMRGYTAELLAKAVDQGALDQELTSNDKEQLTDYLVREGFLDFRSLSYKGTLHRGLANFDAMGLMGPNTASEPLAFKELLESGLGNSFQAVTTVDHPHSMYQPVGGMDQIAKAFEREVQGSITYNAEVQELRQNENGVRVPYRNTATGETEVVEADFCISTIPLSIMRKLSTDLSEECQEAIAKPRLSTVGKLALQMKRRFWEEDDDIYGGSSTLGIPGHTVIYPSYGLFGQKGVIQSAYAFGRTAVTLGDMTLDEQVKQAIERTERIHPGQFASSYDGKAFSIAWHKEKYAEGGWTQWSPPDRQKYLPILREAQGRVYFAGDYISGIPGWQVGAIESAWTQIEKIHARASQG